MSGHGRFSVIGGSSRPLPIELPKVEDLKPSGNTLGALNVDGVRKDGPAVAGRPPYRCGRVRRVTLPVRPSQCAAKMAAFPVISVVPIRGRTGSQKGIRR